jgi:hypothetical protein
MISEQEKRNTLNKMSDLEYAKNDVEMMRYRANTLSHKLGLLAMAFSIFGAFVCLNSIKPNDVNVLIIIMINIVILLGGFLAAERAKTYSYKGSIALVTFGGICIARMFYVPIILLTNFATYSSLFGKEGLTEAETKALADATSHLGETITYKNTGAQAVAFLPSSGTFRGVFAMVLFALAGAAFIVAGVIGILRSMKLSRYLDSIKEKD